MSSLRSFIFKKMLSLNNSIFSLLSLINLPMNWIKLNNKICKKQKNNIKDNINYIYNEVTKNITLSDYNLDNFISILRLLSNGLLTDQNETNFLEQIILYKNSEDEIIFILDIFIKYGYPINNYHNDTIDCCLSNGFFKLLLKLINLGINTDTNTNIKYKTNILFDILSNIETNGNFDEMNIDMNNIIEIFKILLEKIDINEQNWLGDTIIHKMIYGIINKNIFMSLEFYHKKNNFYFDIFKLLQELLQNGTIKYINLDIINHYEDEENISVKNLINKLNEEKKKQIYELLMIE